MRPFPIALALLAALACSTVAPGQPPSKFEVGAVDAYVAATVEQKGLAGLSLAVVKDGAIVLAKGYGKRSLEAGTPVETGTPFSIGSVTKQFVCASILLLAEDGKLSVDDKVAKFFPELTRAGEITLGQLMSHTSGYPDYYPLDFVDRRLLQPIVPDALVKQYAGGKLDFEPGARWSYSNTGYTILGRVIEKVSGQPLAGFLRRRIFDPVGMDHAALDPTGDDPARARGYLSFALGPHELAAPETDGWLYAAGGIWASAADLARWDLALMAGWVLGPDSIRQMTTPTKLNDGRVKDYGFGLNVRQDGGETVLAHGGAISGFRASNVLLPKTRSAVVVLINDEQPDPGISDAIVRLLLKPTASPDVPTIDGPPAREVALAFFHQMQAGELDRSRIGEEFSVYLTDERVKAAAPRLKALGEPSKVEVLGANERGGMEVASVRFTFPTTVLRGVLYRSPDGKIQQLLLEKN
jgi:D-alanyl-D-alanine carboxypeptidase